MENIKHEMKNIHWLFYKSDVQIIVKYVYENDQVRQFVKFRPRLHIAMDIAYEIYKSSISMIIV